MKWVDNWPEIGIDTNGDGVGEPVSTYKKPNVGKTYPYTSLNDSDEFNETQLRLQWQWHANPKGNWGFPSALGYFMLNCIPKPKDAVNLFDIPNLMLQKFPTVNFTATTKFNFNSHFDGEEAGLVIMGLDYNYLRVKQIDGKLYLSQMICKNANKKEKEEQIEKVGLDSNLIYLKVKVIDNATCTFSYSQDGSTFKNFGIPFTAKEGKWIGAKLGFVALREGFINDAGNITIDWIRFNN